MSETEEDARQRRFLETPQGEKRSGAVRYAAAMYFFQRGLMSERDLEFYRARSKVDGVSPITQLLAESERYIGGLDCAGRAEVLDGITRWSQVPFTPVTPKQVPMLLHLAPALAAMKDRSLAALIEAAAPLLRWVTYPYEGQNIGERFPQRHAFATLIGEYGPYKAPDFDLGLFLIAPQTFYRDHHQKSAGALCAPHRPAWLALRAGRADGTARR